MSIHEFVGQRQLTERQVHYAYEKLSEYAANPKANEKAVAARKKTLDIFADGWNSALDYIAQLEAHIEHLKSENRQFKFPKRSVLDRPVTFLDFVTQLASFRYENRTVKEIRSKQTDGSTQIRFDTTPQPLYSAGREAIRDESIRQAKTKWPELF